MAFLTPSLFPGTFCWEDSDVDPLTIIHDPIFAPVKPYNFACSLKQAMELYWIGQVYNLEGTSFWSVLNTTTQHTGDNQINQNTWGLKDKMSEILCTNSGTGQTREGIVTDDNGARVSQNELSLGIVTHRTLAGTLYRIRKYKDLYYPLVVARIGVMSAGGFPYTEPNIGGSGTVEFQFLDGSKIEGIGTNVSQIPDSQVSGSMAISILTNRQNS
jgi:hypothetical protein